MLSTDALMRRIVRLLPDDCMRPSGLPTLSGSKIGELTPCVPFLGELGFWEAALQAQIYARRYGGGGVVCFVRDGKKNDEEIDINNVQEILGFYALPKWYLTPLDNGSSRLRAAWYGQRIGRPEMYSVTPINVSGGAVQYPDVLQDALSNGGYRFHRSRIIPWQYCDDMDLQLARRFNTWNGWGPGVIEACLAAFLNRRSGALRIADMMNSAVFNVLTMANLNTALSTPNGGSPLKATLEGIKACLAFTGDGLPLTAVTNGNTLEPKSHNLSGIDKLVSEQRKYLLDVVEYPEVVLFSSGGGNGLSGDANEGQWRNYHNLVASTQQSWCWQAGCFGGGIRQAVLLAMACKNGPTKGEMDTTVKANWPFMGISSEKERAETRLKDAQARNLESITFGIRSEAMARLDPTVQRIYPALDVDDGELPSFSNGGIVPLDQEDASLAKAGSSPAQAVTALVSASEPDPNQPTQDAGPPTPVTLPTDIATESEIATALRLSRSAFRKWIETTQVTTFPTLPGTRGGHRYSMGEVLKAWNALAQTRRTDRKPGVRVDSSFLESYQDIVMESEREADAWIDARVGMDSQELVNQATAIWRIYTNMNSVELGMVGIQKGIGKEVVQRSKRLEDLPEGSWTLGTVRNAVWAAKVIARLQGAEPVPFRDQCLRAWGYDPNK